jgi:hypothetical protein
MAFLLGGSIWSNQLMSDGQGKGNWFIEKDYLQDLKCKG